MTVPGSSHPLGERAIPGDPPETYADAATRYAEVAAHRMDSATLVGQDTRWPRRTAVAGVILGVVGNLAVALSQTLPSSAETAIVLGILIVVTLGAGGLACRGVGELRDSAGWKAAGCFLCAAAYLGTATVALVNGVPLIFQP